MPFWKRPYYWEFVGIDPSEIPRWQRGWHISRWAGGRVIHGMEFVGEVLAELIGLNKSTYQWVIDSMDEEERRKSHREEINSRRRETIADVLEVNRAKKMDQAEGGEGDDDSDTEETNSLLR
mmetsp:Transcript_18678/g.24315  ORF Transcript_18678/g.24315 Transcript_18678/m.24315 type:complete len:122 (-) Transcript_18678:306-671(-)